MFYIVGDSLSRIITYQEKDLVGHLTRLLPYVIVYARMAPKQKEWVINGIKSHGYFTLMCGDGTNDVGALKHAHVGVAILSHCPEWVEKRQKLMQEIAEKRLSQNQSNGAESSNNVAPGRLPPVPVRATVGPGGRVSTPRRTGPGNSQGRPGNGRPETNFERQLAKMMKELEEEEKGQIVKLGDASIAAPFSSKMASIECSKITFLKLTQSNVHCFCIKINCWYNCYYSLPCYQARTMYFGDYASDVQNSRLKCSCLGVQSVSFVFRRN